MPGTLLWYEQSMVQGCQRHSLSGPEMLENLLNEYTLLFFCTGYVLKLASLLVQIIKSTPAKLFWFHNLNVHGHIFQTSVSVSSSKIHHSIRFCILQLPISYYGSLIMVTLTRHIFISIFQMEHFSALKFDMGYEKKWAFLWYYNLQKFEKKLKKSDWVPVRIFPVLGWEWCCIYLRQSDRIYIQGGIWIAKVGTYSFTH